MRARYPYLGLIALGGLTFLAGTARVLGQQTVPPPAAGPDLAPATKKADAAPVVVDKDDTNAVNPTGRQEPGVSLEWVYPATARVGQKFTCTLVVKSLSTNPLQQVEVFNRIPAGIAVQETEPKAATESDLLIWRLGTLEPRQEKRLDVHLVSTTKGSLPYNAFVRFVGSATAKLEVREPQLAIKATAPQKVILGDLALFSVTVSNPGDARADHVKVKAVLPEGLECAKAQNTDFDLDTLDPGESRTVLVQCFAKTPGPQEVTAVAVAAPDLVARTTAHTEVLVPRLDVVVSGPNQRFLDLHAVYNFKVTNPGTAPASRVTIHSQVPRGFKVVSANGAGRYDDSTGMALWFMEELGPGESKEVSLDLLALNPGAYKLLTTVTADRGLRAAAKTFTRLEGLPGLQMELIDLADPVEVGKDVNYEIRVRNTGTRTETNLQLVCTLPEKAEFLGARCGAPGIDAQLQGRDVVFASIPKLAPRADVIFRVTARCLAPGDLRFQARVRADGLESPVLREESTRVFGD